MRGLNHLPNESFDQAPREEKQILEKTAQILQENQLKNEQLAKQVRFFSLDPSESFVSSFQTKTFQEKVRRNEIYSALNRYSYRPPIYPSKSHRFGFSFIRNNICTKLFLGKTLRCQYFSINFD